MDNTAIAHLLREIADLLELKNDNAFKIRAYRNGADIVANHPHQLAQLDATALREIPGIGKDLAARIRKAIVADDSLSTNAKNVKIVTENGGVTLRGPVSDARERETVSSR